MTIGKKLLIAALVIFAIAVNFAGYNQFTEMLTKANDTSNSIGALGMIVMVGLDIIFIPVLVKFVKKK